MAVTIEIGERSFKVAPFMLDEMCEAAPFIDEMNEQLKRLDPIFQDAAKAKETPSLTLSDMASLARPLCEILAVGISRVDPAMDAAAIRKSVGVGSIISLQHAVNEILKASGMMHAGEAPAPSPRKRKGAKA